MSLDRFGTTFEVKSIEQRVISGHAAAWALDRVGDVIDKAAFTKTLREKRPSDVAVFIGHKADELPVGVPLSIQPDEHGLFTTVKVFDGPAGDNLLAVARGLKAAGQTLGLSIGYRVRDSRIERLSGKTVRLLTDIDLIEFSYAARQTVANPAALMTDVKQRGGGMPSEKEAADSGGQATYPNTLPDSAFLHIAEGGVLDDEGKTVPRGLRYFRFRGADGALDREALAVALTEIPAAKSVGLDADDLARLGTQVRRTVDAIKTGADPEADAAGWKTGAAVDLLTVAYGLIDLAESVVAEHRHRAALGEDTKSGWRLQSGRLESIKALSDQLGRLTERAALVAAGKDEEALAAWWQAQFELMGVAS